MMAAIAADAESSFPFDAWIHRFEAGGPLPEAVARAACTMAADIAAAAIVTCTQSGGTAQRVARYGPGRRSSRQRRTPRPTAGWRSSGASRRC